MTGAFPSSNTPAPTDPRGAAVDDLNRSDRRRSGLLCVAGLATVLLVTVPVGVGVGPLAISPATVTKIFGYLFDWPHAVSWSTAEDAIVWQVRAPRVILGAVVGAGLSVTGVTLQALVRNVLADPFLLGVSSGASTGAVATILSAVTSFLIFASGARDGAQAVLFWLLGSLALARD